MNVLVYDDNPDYGGHQIMACHGIESLAADPSIRISFMYNAANTRLAERIHSIGNLQPLESPVATHRFQGLRNRLFKAGIMVLTKQFHALKPDLILCIQGEIEDSSQAVLAARRANIECVSYLAIPHPMQLMGAKMGHLRDRTNQYLINQPSRYITISDSMADFLRERGVTVPIDIVPNGVPAPKTPNSQLPTTLPSEQCTLGMLGRIEFKQKQQNFMVRTFIDLPDQFKNCHLLIAGSGPDQEKLKKLIQKKDNITLLPWQGDTEAFYSAIDFLMLPSRFEGVPLVMLEALARGIPVIGSRRDGMQDLLPEAWTFQPGKEELLAQTFSKARLSWKDSIDPLQEMVQTKMSIPAFQQKFHEALLERD